MDALFKLILIFVGIVLLLRLKWNLGLVLLLASVAVGLLFAHPLPQIGRDVLAASVDPLTLRLALIVVLIMVVGELLRQTDALKGLVESLQELIPNGRIVLATLPPLVGLLPMVGGAMFSAPMVDEVGDRLGVDGGRKTFVNYWFRHVWEPIFPLYPSMLLAAQSLRLTPMQLIGVTWPLTVAAVVGGSIFGLLGLPRQESSDSPSIPRGQSLRTLATSIWPVLFVVILSLALSTIDERVNLLISLSITIALMMLVKHIPLLDLGTILRRRIPWKAVVIIFGVMIFQRVLMNSGAVYSLADLQIPLMVISFVAPFIAGLLTGLMSAAFGIGFPVILPLLVADGESVALGWAAWMLAGGFLGTMFSPLHLCLALTRVYFKASWGAVYRRIAPSALLMAITAAAIQMLA